jgi:glucokinase
MKKVDSERMKGTKQVILTGDIGGTKTRLALYRLADEGHRRIRGKIFSSKQYEGLEMILEEFLGTEENVDCASFGVAGPILKGRVNLTNLPWVIDTKTLQKELKLKKVVIVNDLVANAHGLSMLKENDFVTLNVGKERKGNAALISAGTGLGEAILFYDGKRTLPSPSEGGHVDFGPRNRLEINLLQYLLKDFAHVSYERILSGDGLYRIYQFFRDSRKFGKEPAWLSRKLETEDPAAVISQAARDRNQELCINALDLFSSIYGAEAGNLALKAMAIGGVYVGGGIAPKILWKLKDGGFMKAFRDKGRYANMMGQIPVRVIMNEETPLLGALSYAIDLLNGHGPGRWIEKENRR